MAHAKKRTALVDPRFSLTDYSEKGDLVITPEVLGRSFFRRMRADGKSEHTITRYQLCLRQYLEHAELVKYPWPPRAEHLADYFATMREAGKARNTVRNAHVGMRSFFNWLLDEGEITENPMSRLKTPTLENVSPEPYTDDEVKAMLSACKGNGWVQIRDAAIIGVLADTGLRASEFCCLTVEDVELDVERIRIVGKGGRHRYIGLGASAQTLLDRYVRRRTSRRPDLWVGRSGAAITGSGLYQIIERIGIAAKINRKGIHRFRHYAATSMLRNGMGELDLARFMGWSTLAMAQRYTKSEAQDRALKAHRQNSPLDRLR